MKFIVDFERSNDMPVTKDFLCLIEKLGILKFKQLYSLEHWFSDIMIIEYD